MNSNIELHEKKKEQRMLKNMQTFLLGQKCDQLAVLDQKRDQFAVLDQKRERFAMNRVKATLDKIAADRELSSNASPADSLVEDGMSLSPVPQSLNKSAATEPSPFAVAALFQPLTASNSTNSLGVAVADADVASTYHC